MSSVVVGGRGMSSVMGGGRGMSSVMVWGGRVFCSDGGRGVSSVMGGAAAPALFVCDGGASSSCSTRFALPHDCTC